MHQEHEMAGLLGDWRQGGGPLYRRLAGAIQSAIADVRLLPGAKLPAERLLARALGVSRTTVAQAYEVLRRDGWAESRQGSGTWITAGAQRFAGMGVGPPLLTSTFFRRLPDGGASLPVDLSVAGPSPLDLVFAAAERLPLPEVLGTLPPTGYAPLGLPLLRRLIASRFSQAGAPTDEQQILVTSGAQQAISLIASACVERGDAVVLEAPTYAGALDAFSRAGARVVPLPVGPAGVPFEKLRDAVKAVRPRLVYLMPTFQNPTGAVIPERERRRIAQLADELQVTIVEDNTLAEVTLEGTTPPPLAHYSEGGTVVSLGSMSKLFWPGLRLGWIRASASTVAGLGQLKVMSDLGTSALSQALACMLLPDTRLAVAARKGELLARRKVLETGLKDALPEWAWNTPKGGLFLWVRLPLDDARSFVEAAWRHGVAVTPGAMLAPDGRYADHVRICFVVGEDELRLGIERLARAWKSYGSTSGPVLDPLSLPV